MFSHHRDGFTLIELLMVIMLLGILTAIGINQFVNFSADAKNATIKANLQLLRSALQTQNGQMIIRCGVVDGSWPPMANLIANDITLGGMPCTTTQVPLSQDRTFVMNSIPINPWGVDGTNVLQQCTGGCADRTTECLTGAARDGSEDGWCYDETTGQIWANTSYNDGTGITGTENQY